MQHPEMSFYIALPSDSSTEYFPENKISGYTTNLPCKIVLDGSWEFGVVEVRYPFMFLNVLGEMSLIKARNTIHQHTMRVTPGFYTTGDVVKKINSFISKDGGEVKVNNHTGKISVTTGNHSLYMSPALYDFLGRYFKPKNPNRVFKRSSIYRGQRVLDIRRSFNMLFIDYDILAPRIVRDTHTHLFSCISTKRK